MTPNQLKYWMALHGFNKVVACQRLGISRPSLDRYLAGERPVPRLVLLAMRAIDAGLDVEG